MYKHYTNMLHDTFLLSNQLFLFKTYKKADVFFFVILAQINRDRHSTSNIFAFLFIFKRKKITFLHKQLKSKRNYYTYTEIKVKNRLVHLSYLVGRNFFGRKF